MATMLYRLAVRTNPRRMPELRIIRRPFAVGTRDGRIYNPPIHWRMAILSLLCPKCGGTIELEGSRDFGFCAYCGTKIMIEKPTEGSYQSIEGLHRLILLNRGDALKVSGYAEDIVRMKSDDPVSWYFLTVADGRALNTDALKIGVRSCGGPERFLGEIKAFLESNEAGPIDSRVEMALAELYPELVNPVADSILKRISGWSITSWDAETASKYEAVRDEISEALKLPIGNDRRDALLSLLDKLDSDIYAAKQVQQRRVEVICTVENAMEREVQMRLFYGRHSSMMIEKSPGTFVTSIIPRAGSELSIEWRLSIETAVMDGTRKAYGILPVKTQQTVPIWHKGRFEIGPDMGSKIVLGFKKSSGCISFSGGDLKLIA